MAINDIVQTIAEARVDARSLSEFVFKPAGFKVARRLAPTVDTLQFYINRFNSLNGDFSSSVSVALSSLNSSVAEADGKVAYIESTVQDAINNTAVEGGVLADTFITVTALGAGRVARTLREKNNDRLSVKDFGAIGDGTLHTVAEWTVIGHRNYFPNLAAIQASYPHVSSLEDSIDWAAIQASVTTYTSVLLPKGNYCVNKQFVMPRGFMLQGQGVRTSTITSYLEGESLFKLDSSFVYGDFSHLTIKTHSSVSSTSGHGISALGYVAGEDSESHSPQHLSLNHVEISGFNGLDAHYTTGLKTLPACGFIQTNGLGTRLNNVTTASNGIGMLLYNTSTTRINECNTVGNKYWGILAYLNTNIIVEKCNHVSNGALGTSAEANNLLGDAFVGAVLLKGNYNAVYQSNKSKGSRCSADIVLLGGEGTIITKNNIRGGYSVDHDAFQCIYVGATRDFVIEDNTFHGVNITTANSSETAKYKAITVRQNTLFHSPSGSISNNMFRGITASTVAYYVGLIGENTANKILFKGMTIEGNKIGNSNAVASWTIETGILVKNCQLQDSSIQRNIGYVSLQLTAGNIVRFESVVSKRNKIMANGWYYAGTFDINAPANDLQVYSGIDPDTQSFTHRLESATNVQPNGFTDILINANNIKLNNLYSLNVGFSQPLLGLLFSAWVSADNEVTLRLTNPTAASINIAAGYINIDVNRMDRADLGELL